MNQLNLTSTVLDKLGFSEYWDESGDWGGRTLTFSNGEKFRIAEYDEKDDDSDGYSKDGEYVANHYSFVGWFALPKLDMMLHKELFFLQQMYECIKDYYPSCVDEFIQKCKVLRMGNFIQD